MGRYKKATGCLRNIRPRFSLGCPEASQGLAELEAMVQVGIDINFGTKYGNSAKPLEAEE